MTMAKSATRSSCELRLQVSAIVRAPWRRAYSTAATVKGVRPLEAIPTTTSFLPGFFFAISSRPSSVESSLASVAADKGLNASGNNELDRPWIGIKGGAAFRGVEGSDASAGAGADVDEASTFAQRGGDLVDSASDLRQGTLHGSGDGGVFLVDEAGDFERGFAVEVGGGGIGLLGAEAVHIGGFARALQRSAFRSGFEYCFMKLVLARRIDLCACRDGRAAHFYQLEAARTREAEAEIKCRRQSQRWKRCASQNLSLRTHSSCKFLQRLDDCIVKGGPQLLDGVVRAIWPSSVRQQGYRELALGVDP